MRQSVVFVTTQSELDEELAVKSMDLIFHASELDQIPDVYRLQQDDIGGEFYERISPLPADARQSVATIISHVENHSTLISRVSFGNLSQSDRALLGKQILLRTTTPVVLYQPVASQAFGIKRKLAL